MILSDVSIRRPVFASILNVILIIFGLFSLPRLAVDLYPNVDFPVVTVTVIYPGADPESVEQRILDPLEDALNGLAGLKTISSNGFANVAQIVLQFELGKNSDDAASEVRDKVFAAVGELPSEAETPIVQKFDVGGAPIVNIALRGNESIGRLSELTKELVQPALERIDGVARVNPAGLREREVQILLDLERLASFGLGPSDIAQSVRSQNMDLPSGRLETAATTRSIRVKGRLASADEIGNLPIISAHNASLRISDVAEVRDTVQDEENAAFVGHEPAILLALQKVSGANTTGVAAAVRETLVQLNERLPEGTRAELVTDNSVFIAGSIDSVKLDLVLGALLAIVIVLFFLRDWRITLISATALPTAVIATFALMRYLDFTLNMMTTLALSLSIGILIDDAIIVIENIHRHLAMGKPGPKAASDATAEIGLAVFATTLTLCAVFVPVAFMEGIIGRFFFQFGLTVAFAVLISLFVAFTLTPMLSSQLLQPGDHSAEGHSGLLGRLGVVLERGLSALDQGYRRLLDWCLRHRLVTLLGGLAVFVLSILMLRQVPVAFFPKEDRSEFSVGYALAEGSSLAYTKQRSLELAGAIAAYPGVERVVTAVGASGDRKPNKARLDVRLVGKDEREFSQAQFMDRLRQDIVPAFAADGEDLVLSEAGGGGGRRSEAIQFIFKSSNWQDLVAFSDRVADFVKSEVSGAVDVATTKPKEKAELRIRVDTAKAVDLGVTPAQVAAAVRSLFEGEKVGDISIAGKTVDVRLRASDRYRLAPDDIERVSMANRRGEQVLLSSVATIELEHSPSAIERYDGQRQISMLANFTGKDLNMAVNRIQTFVSAQMPASVSMSLSGQAEIMKDSIKSMLQALLLAVILVYLVLCAQYESFLAPLVIMAALPLSLTGAFGALLLTGQVMSVYTMIGIILLMGLVTKNGILLVDFTEQKRREGMSLPEALLEAGPIRLRPILMTTFAAGGGMLPVAIGHGVGGEARSPMGVAVIGGLLVSTLLTLIVVPCLYSAAEGAKARLASQIRRLMRRRDVHGRVPFES